MDAAGVLRLIRSTIPESTIPVLDTRRGGWNDLKQFPREAPRQMVSSRAAALEPGLGMVGLVIFMSLINIGVNGWGRWGPNHVRVFWQLKESRAVACADLDPKR